MIFVVCHRWSCGLEVVYQEMEDLDVQFPHIIYLDRYLGKYLRLEQAGGEQRRKKSKLTERRLGWR